MSGKAAAHLCSTSIVHHRCPTIMAGSSSAVGSCVQNSSCAAQGWHSLADGIIRTCLAMSTAEHLDCHGRCSGWQYGQWSVVVLHGQYGQWPFRARVLRCSRDSA